MEYKKFYDENFTKIIINSKKKYNSCCNKIEYQIENMYNNYNDTLSIDDEITALKKKKHSSEEDQFRIAQLERIRDQLDYEVTQLSMEVDFLKRIKSNRRTSTKDTY